MSRPTRRNKQRHRQRCENEARNLQHLLIRDRQRGQQLIRVTMHQPQMRRPIAAVDSIAILHDLDNVPVVRHRVPRTNRRLIRLGVNRYRSPQQRAGQVHPVAHHLAKHRPVTRVPKPYLKMEFWGSFLGLGVGWGDVVWGRGCLGLLSVSGFELQGLGLRTSWDPC